MKANQKNQDWVIAVRNFKETLAQRLWSIPGISEAEKELLYKQYLVDLNEVERMITKFLDDVIHKASLEKDENDLLRSLLGLSDDELRARSVSLNQQVQFDKKEIGELKEELTAASEELSESNEQKEHMRNRLRDYEKKVDQFRAEQLKLRNEDIEFFAKEHSQMKENLKDLETRISNIKSLFQESNDEMVREKQEEITQLQKSLLADMENTIKRKQSLVWKEEELFAKGIARRIRSALVSVQGQLYLTLERMGLLDPESKTENFWKARWHLMVEGADELSKNFKVLNDQFSDVLNSVDEYLHLSYQKSLDQSSLLITDLVQAKMADLYHDRKPTLSVEVQFDDPLPNVYGDQKILEFIIETLMQNAIEAIPNQVGKIIIQVHHSQERKMIQFLISDSGEGIAKHLQNHLFEPFFSTKEGRSGLSLSRAKRYAELHNGTMELVQTGDEGSMFRLEIPVEDK